MGKICRRWGVPVEGCPGVTPDGSRLGSWCGVKSVQNHVSVLGVVISRSLMDVFALPGVCFMYQLMKVCNKRVMISMHKLIASKQIAGFVMSHECVERAL